MLLYYITDRIGFAGTDSEQRVAMLRRIAEATCAGVDYIQLREKDLTGTELEGLAREAMHIVRDNSTETKLLINRHVHIALAVGADGVHLPSGSPPVSEIRASWLGHMNRKPLIGVSVHSVEDAFRAQSHGASFAVLAPIFEKIATNTKGIGLEVLREACALAPTPIFALGGVNLINARACLDAGAAGIAGIRIFQRGDVAETVRQLQEVAAARESGDRMN